MKKLISILILTAMMFSMVCVQNVGAAENAATLDVYSTGGGYLVMAENNAALNGKDLIFYAASFDDQNRMVGVETEEATVENGKVWANFAINVQKVKYFDSIATTKFLLWDETTAVPLTEVKTNSAATPVATVDAAASSAVFASSATDGHLPEAAFDGNVETYWEAHTDSTTPTTTDKTCYRQRLIVDLGAEYPINSVEYLPADEDSAKMFDIFVTNDSKFIFSNSKYICGRSETAVSTTEATVFPVNDAGSYRYVVVEKIFGNGSLAIKDLKVNVPSEFYDVRVDKQNYLTDNVYGYRTANGKTASAFAYNVYGGKMISQTAYDAISIAVPLNNVSPISHIALESGDAGTGENQYDFRSNFKILGLEAGECTLSGGQPVFDVADADVLATQEGIAGLPDYGFSGLIIYDVPQQFASKEYEYIVFYKDTKYNGKLQLRMNAVYAYNYKKAEVYDSVTDAASDSMVYTITNSTGHSGLYAVDNDPATYYENGSATDAKRNSLVVDLGASYPIASIDYLPMNNDTAASNYSIYVSNDPQFAAKELIHSQGATVADKVNATNYVVVGDTPYRYVLVEKTGKLGVAEINVNVPSEYYADALGVNRANFEVKNRGTKVWRSAMPNAVKAQVGQLNGENTLQTYAHTWNNLTADSTEVMYLYYDLGADGAKVDTIAFADYSANAEPANLARRSDFKVVLSNNADLSNGVTVYTQVGAAGGNDNSGESGIVLYHVPEAYKNNNYRYVGIYKDKTAYINGAWSLRLGYGIMDIYTAKPKQVEYDSVTDAASDSMVYTITNSTGHAGAYAVDNDPATYYESGSTTDAKRNNLVVDLGASYPIASIDYLPMNNDTAASNYSIYVSNDPQFATKELVHSQGATVADKTKATNYPMYDETPYRYVLVEKETGKLGVAEINVNVPTEYYADAAGVNRANFEIKNRGTKAYRSKTSTLGAGQVGQLNGENTLQTYEHYWNNLTQDSTEVLYMYYDLGAGGAKVDTIAYADCSNGTDASNLGRRSDFKVILSNNADLSNGVTVYTQAGVAGGNDNSKDSGLVLYHVPEAYKNTNYRYVGIYKDKTASINGGWRLKIGYAIMDIYTQK